MLDGLEGIMDLAAASGEDLGRTSDIVTDALTAFGLEAKDSGHFADILAAASTNANTNVSMMGETFKYAAPIAGALGYSAEDTAEAIGLMANSGIKASQAGTSLRTIMTNLSKEFKISGENLGEVTIQTTNADGTMRSFSDIIDDTRLCFSQLTEAEKVNTAKTLVGKNAMSGFLALMNSGEGDVTKLRTAIENCNGAAGQMADTMQDNLQGKLTLFNSAMEGLGIALYNYFSGPLQDVVEFATGLISGITELITPQKTELETFIDDIAKANEQVESSIEHAQQTVEGGHAKEAEIEGYKDILTDILDNCAQFNRVDLSDGKFAIVNAAGEIVAEGFASIDQALEETNGNLEDFAPTGIGTEVIRQKIDEITGESSGCLGYISKKAEEVEMDLVDFAPEGINYSKISEGTTAVIQCFDEAGNKVDSFSEKIDSTGNITANFEGVENPTNAVIKILTDAGEQVGEFETTIQGTGNINIDLSKAQGGVGEFIDYLDGTQENTDAFKSRLEDAGGEFPTDGATGSVDSIITYFDENGNEITDFRSNIEEIGKEFDTSGITVSLNTIKEAGDTVYTITDEFAKFQISTIVDALSGSVDGLAEAWNRETGELNAANAEIESWLSNAQQAAMQTALQDAMTELYSARAEALIEVAKANAAVSEAEREFDEWTNKNNESMIATGDTYGEYYAKTLEAEEALRKANDQQEIANENLAKSNEEYNITNKALKELGPVIKEANAEAENANKTQEEAQQALADTQEELGETGTATEDLATKTDEASEKLVAAYTKIKESVHDTAYSAMNAWSEMAKADDITVDQMITNMEKNIARTQEWENNMKVIAQSIGQGFPQELYDELLETGPGKMDQAVSELADICRDPTSEKFKELGDVWIARANEATRAEENLAPFHSTGQAIGAKVEEGLESKQQDFNNAASGLVKTGADSATNAAGDFEQVGEEAATKTQTSVEQNEQQAIDAMEGMVEKGRDAANQMASDFYVTGQQIPQKLRNGINDALNWAEKGAQGMIDAARKIVEENQEGFKDDGRDSVASFRSGFGDNIGEAEDAARELVDRVSSEMESLQGNLESAASQAMQAMANAISSEGAQVPQNVYDICINAKDNAEGYQGEFETAGYNMAIGLATGINNGASTAIEAAKTMAYNALISAKYELGIASPSKEFMEIGGYADEGMALGFERGRGRVEQEAIKAARSALDAAQREMTGYTDLTANVNVSGMRELENMVNINASVDGVTSAIREITGSMQALTRLADSLSNPQAPNVTVIIGNREFKGYIVNTAIEGMGQRQRSLMRGVGA